MDTLKTGNDVNALTLLVVLLLSVPVVAHGFELNITWPKINDCEGSYNGVRISGEKLMQVIAEGRWQEPAKDNDFNPGANLCGVILWRADLSDIDLSYADLSGAFLYNVNMSNANLTNTILTDTILDNVNLTGAKYQPKAGKQPNVDFIAEAKGLSELTYSQPRALVGLRKLFKDGGYRDQEREITYSINHVRTESLLKNIEEGDLEESVLPKGKGLLGRVEGLFNYVFFDLTTKWGMAPSRALWAIFVLILIFAFPYAYALRAPKKDGIWRFWAEERARTDLGSKAPELLQAKGFHAIGLALYFSILSAFHIGWRDLNVGNWIARIQPREYTLRASGWVRTLSGIQSLLSVYLLAIWALTYFGRPFG